MEHKPIYLDGVDMSKCEWFKDGMCYAECDLEGYTDWECHDEDLNNCYFKQLARKTQECEQKEKELKELKRQYKLSCLDCEYKNTKTDADRYRKALEEIEKIAQNGLSPICYKSNCSCCRCYDGDDCNTSMTSLINNYFTENGEFVDGSGDFVEALEGLLESERKKCNKAQPIAQRILDIINKAKGENKNE